MTDKPQLLDCPSCKTLVQWTEDFPYRPFCSKRCKLVDFGGWAKEEYQIAGNAIYDEVLSGDLSD